MPAPFSNPPKGCPCTISLKILVEDLHRNLQRCATAHRIKSLLVIIQSERVGDHARDINLAAIEKLDGAREAVHMREGSVNLSVCSFRTFND